MSTRKLRRRCAALVDALELPAPFDVRRLVEQISQHRGRPIILVPAAMPHGMPGLWLHEPHRDVILYERDTSGLHQENIQLHELGHILCGHRPVNAISREDSRRLFPGIDHAVVLRTLGRGEYTSDEEREAEFFPSLILAKVRRWRPAPEWPVAANEAAVSRRVAQSLESPQDRA